MVSFDSQGPEECFYAGSKNKKKIRKIFARSLTLLLIFIAFDDSDFSSSRKLDRDFYFRPTMAAPIMYWRDHVGFCRLYGFAWKSDLAPQFQKALEENGEDFEQIRSTVS